MKAILEIQPLNDAQLVERCRGGDREAFARIVERYQSLICALTYGGCGNLQASEDLAQVTFITAWRELPKLQEPARLKAWLCGIARNVLNNSFRQRRRAPTANAEPIDDTERFATDAPSPREHAISRDEEAILWRALQELPATYREPLVLFYREHRSAVAVAEALGLTEEAVHQRLSRGRAMLTERMAQFVETTLRNTGPTPAFAMQVVMMLPLFGGATAAGAGAMAPGVVGAKAGGLGLLAPFAGFITGMVAHGILIRTAATRRERRVLLWGVIACWTFGLGWGFLGQIAMRALSARLQWSDATFYRAMAGFWWVFAVVVATMVIAMLRQLLAAQRSRDAASDASGADGNGRDPSPAMRAFTTIGMYLAYFWGLIFVAWEAQDRAGTNVIAAVAVALGAAYYFHLAGKRGAPALRTAIGHVAVAFAAMLLIVNLRVDAWLAAFHEMPIGEIHQLLPMWVIYGLTLALCFWVAVVAVVTRPAPAGTTYRGK